MKWLLIAVGALIVFVIIGKKAGWIGGEEKKSVTVEKVMKNDIVEMVSASGSVRREPRDQSVVEVGR